MSRKANGNARLAFTLHSALEIRRRGRVAVSGGFPADPAPAPPRAPWHGTRNTRPYYARSVRNSRSFRLTFASVHCRFPRYDNRIYPCGRRRKTAAARAHYTTRASATSNRPSRRDTYTDLRRSQPGEMAPMHLSTPPPAKTSSSRVTESPTRSWEHGHTNMHRALVAWLQHGVHPPVALAPRWAR